MHCITVQQDCQLFTKPFREKHILVVSGSFHFRALFFYIQKDFYLALNSLCLCLSALLKEHVSYFIQSIGELGTENQSQSEGGGVLHTVDGV